MEKLLTRKNNVIHVDPQMDYVATLPAIFSSAHHSMTPNELKAFLFFIGLTQENTPDDELKNYHEYTFYTGELAKRLQENLKKKRPRQIYETFKSLQKKTIEFNDEKTPDDDDAHRKSFALFSIVDFNGRRRDKPIRLSLPAELNQFLYESKERIPFSFDELNRMSSTNAMQIFMYLKTLDAQGTNSIPVMQFMMDLGFNSKSYMEFKILNNRVLKPAEKEIRSCTSYTDFHITNDGCRGRSPRYLYWQFATKNISSASEDRENRLTLSTLSEQDATRIKQLPKEKQGAIMRALQAGFSPSYLNSLLSVHQDTVVFAANIDLAIMQARHSHLTPEETGRMIQTAVTKNWVNRESNREFLKTKELAHRAKLTQMELDLGIGQEVALESNYKKKSSRYFSQMSMKEKEDFLRERKQFILNVFGHKKNFQLDKYLHRKPDGQPDWRYNEVRAARDVIVSMLKNGDLKL